MENQLQDDHLQPSGRPKKRRRLVCNKNSMSSNVVAKHIKTERTGDGYTFLGQVSC